MEEKKSENEKIKIDKTIISLKVEKIYYNKFLFEYIVEGKIYSPNISSLIAKIPYSHSVILKSNIFYVLISLISTIALISFSQSYFLRIFGTITLSTLIVIVIFYYHIFLQSSFLKTILTEKIPSIKWTDNYLAFLGLVITSNDNNFSVTEIAKKLSVKKSSATEMIDKLTKMGIINAHGPDAEKQYNFCGFNFEFYGDNLKEKDRKIFAEYISFLFETLCVIYFELKQSKR